MDMNDIRSRLSGFDIVSFDLYDTLVHRSVFSPIRVFDLMAEMITDDASLRDRFPKERRAAEEAARKKIYPREVDIDAIYRELPYSDSVKAKLKALEKEVEIRCSLANPAMVELVDWCREQGKKVIVTTDMYLDRNTITDILHRSGVCFEALYISGEEGVTKYSGALFQHVLQDLHIDAKNLIHIGDNALSDGKRPEELGIASIIINSSRHFTPYINRALRPSVSDEHYGSLIMRGLSFSPDHTPAYSLGYSVLGPFLYEFCSWLHQEKQRRSLDLLAFVAREGFFIQKCYECLFPEERGNTRYIRINKRVLTSSEEEPGMLFSYLEQKGLIGKRVGLVNNSINGTGQFLLERMAKKENWPVSLFGLQLICSKECKSRLDDRFSTFMEYTALSQFYGYEFFRNALVIEHLLFEPCGTALRLEQEGGSVDVICDEQGCESENNATVEPLQEAAFQSVQFLSRHSLLGGKGHLGTRLLFEFLIEPDLQDATVIGGLLDRDVDGERPLVNDAIPFKHSYLRKKEIPGISWQEGYLRVKQLPGYYYRYFRRRLYLSYRLHHL